MKISFLASHGGSSAKHIIAGIQENRLTGFDVGVLITNNKTNTIYPWCHQQDIEVFHISGKTHPNSEDAAIKDILLRAETDIVILSGYMKKIGPVTLGAFSDRILNIHPSLLPKHGGQQMYGDFVHAAVIAEGDEESGASVQVITEIYDEGPVLLQKKVPVFMGDTVASLGERVRSIEGDLYLNALKKWQSNHFSI